MDGTRGHQARVKTNANFGASLSGSDPGATPHQPCGSTEPQALSVKWKMKSLGTGSHEDRMGCVSAVPGRMLLETAVLRGDAGAPRAYPSLVPCNGANCGFSGVGLGVVISTLRNYLLNSKWL